MLRAAHVAVLDGSYGLGTVQNVISTAFNNLDNQLNLIPPYCAIVDLFLSRNGDRPRVRYHRALRNDLNPKDATSDMTSKLMRNPSKFTR